MESSEGLEKKGSDTIKTTIAKNDLVWGLLGDGEKQEISGGDPCPDDGCDVLPTWRTLAVDARGLAQTNAWCGKRLVAAPPPSSTRRAEQNTNLRPARSTCKNQIYPWFTKVAAVLAAGRPSEKIFEIQTTKHCTKYEKSGEQHGALGLKDIDLNRSQLHPLLKRHWT